MVTSAAGITAPRAIVTVTFQTGALAWGVFVRATTMTRGRRRGPRLMVLRHSLPVIWTSWARWVLATKIISRGSVTTTRSMVMRVVTIIFRIFPGLAVGKVPISVTRGTLLTAVAGRIIVWLIIRRSIPVWGSFWNIFKRIRVTGRIITWPSLWGSPVPAKGRSLQGTVTATRAIAT